MRTFLLPKDYSPRRPLTVTGDRFHYLARVLRLTEGDRISGTGHDGTRYVLRISEIGEESLVLESEGAETGKPEPDRQEAGSEPEPTGEPRVKDEPEIKDSPAEKSEVKQAGEPHSRDSLASGNKLETPRIHLFQALLKGKKMDTVIRQAAEAGVQRIVPVVSEHAVPRYEEGREEKKLRRWETIVREAVQQSGSRVVSEVSSPIEMSRISEHWNGAGPGLFFHQHPLEQSALHRYLSHYPSDVAVAIGPEGGFSDAEIELLGSAGFSPVYLHTNVLRAETAAVYALGAVQTILTERRFWSPE